MSSSGNDHVQAICNAGIVIIISLLPRLDIYIVAPDSSKQIPLTIEYRIALHIS